MSINDGFKNGTIVLDEPRDIYYAGQVILGKVEFILYERLTFSALSVQFIGQATVLWTEYQTEEYNNVRRTNEVKYSGQEEYFNFVQFLKGGEGVTHLNPGTHSIPFKYQIPYTAPSSFSGEKGQVTYMVTVYVEYPDPLVERDVLQKEFTVVAPFDLSKGSPDLLKPVEIEFEEVYSCCLCVSDLMTANVTLPVSGYCSGETIPVSVNVDNKSNFEIDKIILQIVSKEMYRSQYPPAEYILPEKDLVTLKKGPMLKKTKLNLTFDLVVPDMIVPNLENCNIIKVGYFFKVTIVPTGCNNEVTDKAEICIGFLPLEPDAHRNYIHPMQSSLPNAPIPDPPKDVEPKPNMTADLNTPKVPINTYPNYPYPNNHQTVINSTAMQQSNAPYPGNVNSNPAPYPTGMNMPPQANVGYGWVTKE